MRREEPDWQKATELIAKARAHVPQNPTFSYYHALCHLKQGNYAECLSSLQPLTTISEFSSRALYHLGLSHVMGGDRNEGIRILRELAQQDTTGPYGRYAAWAAANEEMRDGRHLEAATLLAAHV